MGIESSSNYCSLYCYTRGIHFYSNIKKLKQIFFIKRNQLFVRKVKNKFVWKNFIYFFWPKIILIKFKNKQKTLKKFKSYKIFFFFLTSYIKQQNCYRFLLACTKNKTHIKYIQMYVCMSACVQINKIFGVNILKVINKTIFNYRF